MRFLTRRAAAVFVAAAAAAICGCDQATGTADKQIKSQLAAAHDAMAIKDEAAATTALTDAVKITDASPEMRSVADSALALRQLSTAYKLIGEIDTQELELSRLVNEATAVAQRVRSGGTAITAYKLYDPKEITTAVASKVSEAQGSSDKRDWVKTGDSSIPTLTASKQNVSKIEGEIAQLKEQKKNLESEQAKLLTDAAAASERSENSKGKESVDVFKTGSDLRKQASEKAIELDKLVVQITRQQADLAVAQGQQKIIESAIAELQQNAQSREAGWSQVDKDTAARKAFAATLIGPKDSSGKTVTIADKAEQIDALVKKIADLRGQAESAASDAVKYYADANKDAQAAQSNLRAMISDPKSQGRPELQAYKDLQDAVQPLFYKLQGAAAERALGNIYASEAASLNRRALLRDTVKLAADSIGQPAPEALAAGNLAGDRDAKLALADDTYKNSEGLLGDVIDQGTESLQTAARVSRTLTYYNWSLLNKLANKAGDASDHLAKAVTDRNAAAEHQVAIPALPSDLGSVPVPTTAPAANG